MQFPLISKASLHANPPFKGETRNPVDLQIFHLLTSAIEWPCKRAGAKGRRSLVCVECRVMRISVEETLKD